MFAQTIITFFLLSIIGVFPVATTFIANLWVLIITCTSIHQKCLHKLDVSIPDTNQENKTEVISNFHKEQMHLTRLFGAIFLVNMLTCVPTIVVSVVGRIIGAKNIPPVTFAYVYIT